MIAKYIDITNISQNCSYCFILLHLPAKFGRISNICLTFDYRLTKNKISDNVVRLIELRAKRPSKYQSSISYIYHSPFLQYIDLSDHLTPPILPHVYLTTMTQQYIGQKSTDWPVPPIDLYIALVHNMNWTCAMIPKHCLTHC